MSFTYRTATESRQVPSLHEATDFLVTNHTGQFLWNGSEGWLIDPRTTSDLDRFLAANRILVVHTNRREASKNRPELARLTRSN